jgi:hypothetical protein
MFHLKLIPFLSDSHGRTDRCEFEDFSNALTTQDAFYLLRNAIHIGDKQEPTDLKSRSGRLISTQVLHIEWKKPSWAPTYLNILCLILSGLFKSSWHCWHVVVGPLRRL